jgi:hypothetical protein
VQVRGGGVREGDVLHVEKSEINFSDIFVRLGDVCGDVVEGGCGLVASEKDGRRACLRVAGLRAGASWRSECWPRCLLSEEAPKSETGP